MKFEIKTVSLDEPKSELFKIIDDGFHIISEFAGKSSFKTYYIELNSFEDLEKLSKECGYQIIFTPKGFYPCWDENKKLPEYNRLEIMDEYMTVIDVED
jgi:hypothetical protein